MENIKAFLKRKNIVFSAKRYGIDALGAMAQGLFCSLLIGTILNTIGAQFHVGFLTAQIAEKVPYTVGGLASFMSGPAMAIAIGYALQAPPLVLFSLAAVGYACNLLGGAGGPLAVLFVAIIAAECGKAISKETKIDILVTPIVTTLIGVGAAYIIAPPIGKVASAFGQLIMHATELQPFLMGILVSVLVEPTAKYGTLGLLRANQIPEITPIIVEKQGLNVACGAIGIGEITSIPTAPAIADAYFRYDGRLRTSLPLENTPYTRK